MPSDFLVTGSKYDKLVRLILLAFLGVTLVTVMVAVSGGWKALGLLPKKAVPTAAPIAEVTVETLTESDLDDDVYLVLSRPSGEYAFMQVKNGLIQDDKLVGLTELVYPNGEARLTSELNGTVNIYDSNNRVIENDTIVLRGVVEVTLADGTTLPVKVINGRVGGGVLMGVVELWNLKDNSRILGTFDTRHRLTEVEIQPSLKEVDTASSSVAKQILTSLETQTKKVIATTTPAAKKISGAVSIDPVTGLAVINSGVIGDAQIANGSITLLKIADGAISTTKLSDSSVTGAKVADGAIGTSELGDSSVTDAKLAQITASNKVAGSAVELKSGGGLAHGSGLTLREDCTTDQALEWDGDSWECRTVSGASAGVSSMNSLAGALSIAGGGINSILAVGSTITVTGTLPDVGTAGTYGNATTIPVLTTDANGRVSGVTNTAISGLTSSALAASAGITNAQLANSNIYVSPGSGVTVSGSPVSLGGTVTIGMTDASTTVKGAASFNSTNFSVVSGAVNTVQNIDTTAEPSFHALTLSHTTNQLVLGTTNTTTISSTAPSANRVATIPALSASDEFVFKNQSQTLSGKTLDAGSNTITGLTNSNLSGTAAIADSNLAQITTASKVAGSAVQLNLSGGLTNNTGLSLITSCSAGELLKWNGSAWGCAADNNTGSFILTVKEADSSPSVSPVTAIEFGPASASSEEFAITDQTGGVVRIRTGSKVVLTDASQALSNKTIAAGSNTISGLTNSNLSGTAGITDANLAQITTASKVAGSSVQLNTNGGISNSTGLTLLTSCSSNQILKWDGSKWDCAADATGGTPSVYTDGGLLSDGTGLSLLRTCSDNQILKWTAASGWTCQADNTGGGSVTVAESDGSPSVGSVTTLQFGPTSTSSDEFVITDQGSGIARIRTGSKVVLTDASQVLTGKTIDGGSNTLQNIANASLTHSSITVTPTSGTGISVSGSPVSLGGTLTIAGIDASTTVKGVASFNSTNFSVASGAVNTIQGISTSASPSFASLNLTNTTNQLVLGTTNTTTITSTAPSASRVATVPALSGNDEFVFLAQSGTLTNKTIAAGSNTISGLTNSNLSGTAGITDANLATISTASKVSGSAVQLNANGGISNSTGLTLLTTCNSGELLKWNGSAWACATDTSGGSPALNTIAAASGANTIASGDNAQVWNWALTTAAKSAFTFGETSAATGGGAQYILNARTLSSSTAAPLGVFARTYPIIDTTAAGGVTIGNATLAQGITIDSGAGAINIGNSTTGKTITIGSATGTGATNIFAGTGNFILDGAGGTTYSFGTSTTTGTFTMGGSSQEGTANLFTGTAGMTLNIGTGNATVYLGNLNGATTINSGTGGITLLTATSGNLSLKTGTTGTVTLDSGTTGAISIGTGSNQKTITLGNATSGTAVNINSGTGGIALLTGTTGNLSLTTGTTGTVTLDSGTTGTVNVATGANAKTINIGNNTDTTTLYLMSGTGGINIGTAAIANSINIGTGGAAKTLTLGSTNTTSTTNIQSGSGGILFTVDGTGSSGQVRIGNSATTTPDLLVLDNGTADPTGINGGMYYSTAVNKFRCYENGAWKNCDTVGSDLQHAISSDTSEALTNVPTGGGQTTLGTVSITPSTATGDVYVSGYAEVRSSNNTDQPFNLVIETTTNCTGTTVGNASNTYTITSAASTTVHLGNVRVAGVAVDPGASAQTYSLCAAITSGGGDTDVLDWQIEAIVIDTGADLAEIYTSNDSSLEPGDVVSFDSSLKAGMQKSNKGYDNNLLGIITTKPGMVIGSVENEGVLALPVALSGRVPVKVSTENGVIKEGDYLTSSSIPGVAMKATKAGTIIGQAMTEYSANGIGTVLAFVKNGMSAGAKMADVMSGIDTTNTNEVLSNLILQKEQIASNSSEISEIFTDRVVSGLEVVTPLVTAQDILVSRDATISGTLFVDSIKARKIEGMEVLTKKLSLLTEEVAGLATDSAEPAVSKVETETNILDVISGKIAEIFKNTVEFIGKVIFRNDVAFLGRPTFNKDTAGFATIMAGGSEVEVTFEKEYATEPIVTATAQIVGGAAVSDIPSYAIADVNNKGFKIRLSRTTGMNIRFAWMALAVSNTASFQGSGGTVITPTPTPTAEVMPTPTLEVTVTPTVEATSSSIVSEEPTPTPTAEVMPTPTLEVTPTE